jgi:ornithine carbamoyltransferase
MNTNLRGRHFVSLKDYSRDDLETILNVGFDLKARLAMGERPHLLADKVLGMLFCYVSTRTRVGFETAMDHLGGHAQYYSPEQLQLGAGRDTWVDTAHVLSRYLDGIMIRLVKVPGVWDLKYGEGHNILKILASHSRVPVINACDDQEHPCQVMADLMTLREKFGHEGYKKKKVSLVWVCSTKGLAPTGIPHDMALVAGKLGMKLTLAYPEGFDLDKQYIDEGMKLAKESDGTIEIVHDINEAVKDASAIYAKGWGAPFMSTEEDAQRRKSLNHWRIEKKHLDIAAEDVAFMNAMPLEREIDATSEVVDGPRSIIYDQAENRLHAQKAILSLIMG